VPALRLFVEGELEERPVVEIARALRDTRYAFDRVAPTYDRSNRANPTLCDMRARTLQLLDRLAPRGARVLNLGCGPGTDEEHLAAQGYQVTAIDWSPEMVREARRRVASAALEDRVIVEELGIHELDRLDAIVPRGTLDAAVSNLGPLNCVPDLGVAARLIADRLRPGGVLVASVIGRVCPWELALYLWRGNPTRARIRFATDLVAVPLEGGTVWTRYYTPAAFERAFAAAGFTRVALRAMGLLVPPPYMQAFADRHRGLVDRLQQVEDAIGSWPGVRAWGDHFLIALRRA
jgi:SAM-dependent methyltransferase